ncbi:MAG TPA: DNA repair protein RecN [Oscillospiraceae bacterium]|nr:DNA repair protein RecN [Oscillospiraceae bacterium]HPF55642.1 DNA repair protein RecN [Clostridiales bacterium]HPK34209.1 DNA repair protein RecN [Oscillospiraceae bacterium]HPR74888.1 DNA repair protein RecN [Oscillospiraceae bacterium]
MLTKLYIENVAVIKSADVDFNAGFTVLTGETGAGKSVIIDSVNAILGQRTSKDLVRYGAPKAYVSATFSELSPDVVKLLDENGYDHDEGELILSREIQAGGKTTARINSRPATAQILQELGNRLINIHGQHDNQKLLDENAHLDILDSLGEYPEALADYQTAYIELKHIKSELEQLLKNINDREERLEILKYQINELESAHLQKGEIESLEAERLLIMHAEKVAEAVENARSLIDGNSNIDGVRADLTESVRQLDLTAKYSENAGAIAKRLDEITMVLQEISFDLSDLADGLNFDPGRQAEIEDRLNMLDKLRRKYGDDETAMLDKLTHLKAEYDILIDSDFQTQKLKDEFDNAKQNTFTKARALSERRHTIVTRFMNDVAQELAFLQMPNVKLEAAFEKIPLSSTGYDKVVFLISANIGEPPKSISKIASGGELSRIMLAIKSVLSSHDDIPTLIFDEIDAGVSGKTASKIGIKMKHVSKNRQVICVTHLAQIGAYADSHLLIEKAESETDTRTTISVLDAQGRVDELARILGGSEITETTRSNARELLAQAAREQVLYLQKERTD